MAVNPQEDVLKRLQGIKDPRGLVGEMARGKNMYPGGDAARTGGGPGIGRPPEAVGEPGRTVTPEMLAAVQAKTGTQPVPQQMQNPTGLMAAKPLQEKQASKLAKASMQAAAQRKLQRR